MIDVSECINAWFRIIVNVTQHAIYHTWSSCCCSNLTRIQHIQRECIIGLVTTTISNWSSSLQPHFCCSSLRHDTLLRESWYDISYQWLIKSIIVKQEFGDLILLEIPEHAFRQATHRCVSNSWQTQCQIITRQHHLIYFIIQVRFILLNPCQLSCSKVTWRIQQVRQALLATQITESSLAIRHSTWITPDNSRTQRLVVLVYTNQSVHLIWNTNGFNFFGLSATFSHNLLQWEFCVLPPRVRILLGPTCFNSHNRRFLFWEESRSHTLAAIGVD